MSGHILVSHPPAPQSVPPASLPARSAEKLHNTGESSSSGLATAGFRTAKYLLQEWQEAGYNTLYQAFNDRDGSERNRHEAKQLVADCDARARHSQSDSTKKFGERLLDVHYWRSELEREIRDIIAETALLLQSQNRLQRALDATQIPYAISTDNLKCREQRLGGELVRDGVEMELLKEVELIRNIQGLLKRTLEQAVQQIRSNRNAKEKLEMDCSDKVEAYDMDDKCGRYTSQSTNIQFHLNSAKFEENNSNPESWAQHTHDNIYRAENERIASINLRFLIDSILQDTSEDLRYQCDTVNNAFGTRCEEVEDSKKKMEDNLQKTLVEIGDQENNIAALKQAIKDEEAPIKVAQTRLYDRSFRPNMELCRDHVQFQLVSEVGDLTEAMEFLKRKLEEAEKCLHHMEDTRMSLEKDIANKANALFIDREKCMYHRTRYPTVVKLGGY